MPLIIGKRSGLVSPFFRQGLIPGGAITRYFINLDSSVNSYYELAAPIACSGVFNVKFNLYAGNALGGDGARILGEDSSNGSFIKLFNDNAGPDANVFRIFISGNPYSETVTLDRTKQNTFEVDRNAANLVTFKLNGVVFATPAVVGGVFNVSSIGQGWNTNYTDGIISDVIIDNAGTVTTFKLDEPTANTEQSVEGNNSVTYNNIATSDREEYQFSGDATQWDNISPEPQELPAIIEIAEQS